MKVGGRLKYLHRYVMEVMLGRELTTREHVHHVDNNGHNNHPSNLIVLDAAEHLVQAQA